MNRPSNYCGHCGNRTQTIWLQISRPAVGIRPIKNETFYDFYLWFVPHNLVCGHTEQGSEQSTLSHLFLFGWVATPMKSKFLSSVQVGLLSFYFSTRGGTWTLKGFSQRCLRPPCLPISTPEHDYYFIPQIWQIPNINKITIIDTTPITETVLVYMTWSFLFPCHSLRFHSSILQFI